MKPFFPLLAAAVWLLAAAPASAGPSLGDTPEQTDAACGVPGSTGHTADNVFEARGYDVHGVEVLVFFYGGIAGQISYRVPASVPFTERDVQKMLDDNRGRFTWKAAAPRPGPDGTTIVRWDRADGAFASVFMLKGKNAFVVETRAYQASYRADADFLNGPATKKAGAPVDR